MHVLQLILCRTLVNQKYRDPHFDIEADFKRSQQFPDIPPDCLTALTGDATTFQPMSVKRIEVRRNQKLRRSVPR